MFYLFAALLAITALGIWGTDTIRNSFMSGLVCPILVITGCLGLIVVTTSILPYIAAQHKANIINKQYGTHYTRDDVFYAGDVINEIHRVDLTNKSED